MNIGELQRTIYNPILKQNTKSFLDNDELEDIKNNYSEGVIMNGMQYRPDVVADYYMGDSNYAWLITYINDFYNGIKDYTLGKKIKIPLLR